MKLHQDMNVVGGSIANNVFAPIEPASGEETAVERLPFTVRIAHTEQDLSKAVKVRQSAYARHVPDFAERLAMPEPNDREEDTVVLLAESKLDGSPLGTMRVQTNEYRRLALEGSLDLPDWLKGRKLAEATRLGVIQGRVGHVVKVMLFKAFLLYCLAEGVHCMVITARSPIDRQYEALLFRDVYPGRGYIPMAHVGNMPHRVLALEPATAEMVAATANHPLHKLFFGTRHPDIKVEGEMRQPALRRWTSGSSALLGVPA